MQPILGENNRQIDTYQFYSQIDMCQRLRPTPALHLAEEATPRPHRRRRLSHVGPQVHPVEPGVQVRCFIILLESKLKKEIIFDQKT